MPGVIIYNSNKIRVNMNKLDKNKQIERPKVEPLGDMRIAEARSK
jgi:hypothetical protein